MRFTQPRGHGCATMSFVRVATAVLALAAAACVPVANDNDTQPTVRWDIGTRGDSTLQTVWDSGTINLAKKPDSLSVSFTGTAPGGMSDVHLVAARTLPCSADTDSVTSNSPASTFDGGKSVATLASVNYDDNLEWSTVCIKPGSVAKILFTGVARNAKGNTTKRTLTLNIPLTSLIWHP